jgi:DNA gyrase inhibitor GyrI
MALRSRFEIKNLPLKNFASLSFVGSQQIEPTFGKLIRISSTLGLLKNNPEFATIYLDSFRNTPSNKVRMKACVALMEDLSDLKGLEKTSTQEGAYIVNHLEIRKDQFQQAWIETFTWMKSNNLQYNGRPPFEIYYNSHSEHPEDMLTVELCIPIDS